MEQKERFVHLARSGRFTITELCADFGISRKTAYKYLKRYGQSGREGLLERSRRPRSCAHSTSERVKGFIFNERRKYPTWGPKKLRQILINEYGVEPAPARSTIANFLKARGLVQKRKRKPGGYRIHPEHLTEPTMPNEVWSVDFKGWFLLGNGERCDPLTVCDRFSRYVISCDAQANQQFEGTLKRFKAMMRYHGLPKIIRVDNGVPFASSALAGLSKLSVWWIEQGIAVEFIKPASPQENGSHERMHRDLKAEATKPPSANLSAQQKRFDRWKKLYNEKRPHESLDMRRPADIYHPSEKRLGQKYKMRYPENYTIRKVTSSGHIRHHNAMIYLGDIFGGCRVGLYVNEHEVTEVHYANLHLGNLSFEPDGFGRPTVSLTRPVQKDSSTI